MQRHPEGSYDEMKTGASRSAHGTCNVHRQANLRLTCVERGRRLGLGGSVREVPKALAAMNGTWWRAPPVHATNCPTSITAGVDVEEATRVTSSFGFCVAVAALLNFTLSDEPLSVNNP
jgi:hypothetical protein